MGDVAMNELGCWKAMPRMIGTEKETAIGLLSNLGFASGLLGWQVRVVRRGGRIGESLYESYLELDS